MTAPQVPVRAADVMLADGSTAHVRQIQPADAAAIVDLHSRFSERTRYLRYFSPYPRIPPRDLDRFVTVDHHEREAFVVELNDQLIAVGRYDRLGPQADEAEVAFVVEDAYQGRGLGSVLLEHLAAAAREEGISRFVAEVLPVNAPMLRVFADAGYVVARQYADGVVHLSFPIAPTAASVEVQRFREHRAEAASIARLLSPSSVAVYGASASGTGVGAVLLRHLRTGGYPGRLYAVHPSAETIDGVPAVSSLGRLVEPVDLAVVAVPADVVPMVVADCASAGVHGLVVVSAGFAESGPSGARAQAELVRVVRGHGMRLIGPNCLGVANTDPAVRLNATLASRLPGAGRVGFFSQSAALGTALLAAAERRGLGLSSFVSAGNRADVSGNDLLQYWRDDPGTDVVLLYLETFGNPRKFARIARELARQKPVAAVASAVRPAALRAVATGPDERGVAALFARSGVIRVDTVAELFDVGLLLATQPLPAGDRVAVVTNAAALGALAAGAVPAAGLRLVTGYPADQPPDASPAELADGVRRALCDPEADAVLVAYAPVLTVDDGPTDAVLAALRDATAGADKPVAAVLPAATEPVAAVLPAATEPVPGRAAGVSGGQAGVAAGGTSGTPAGLAGALPRYPGVEEALRALGRVADYAAWRREPAGVRPALPGIDLDRARLMVADLAPRAVAEGGVAGEALLGCYGIEVVPSITMNGPADAVADAADRIGYPVALKVAGWPWQHRIDLGAVRLDLGSRGDVRRAYHELERLFGRSVEVTVQLMVPPGVACVVEAVDDPGFGPVVGFGLGGVASELIGDRAWRPAPLTDRDAAALVRAPRAAPLLTGYGGSEPVDLEALEELLCRVGRLADDHPRLHRVELNPVLARADGLAVLGATVQLGAPATRPDTGPRRLA